MINHLHSINDEVKMQRKCILKLMIKIISKPSFYKFIKFYPTSYFKVLSVGVTSIICVTFTLTLRSFPQFNRNRYFRKEMKRRL